MSHTDEAIYTCPGCGAYGTVEAFTGHADAAVCASLMGQMPAAVATAVERYARLFAPAKHRMTWKRQRKVLESIAPLIEAQLIKAKGRTWPAPHAAWISAINTMLDSRTMELPLTTHGYLQKILMGLAEKAEAESEQQREDTRKRNAASMSSGARPTRGGDDDPAMFASHVRTALALLVQEAKLSPERFKTEFKEADARTLLTARAFAVNVIERAISDWHRIEALQS